MDVTSTEAAVPQSPPGLPFPTRSRDVDKDGQYVVEYLDVPNLRNKHLERICKYLGLKGYSGKPKGYLVDVLTKFSALGNNGWKEHFTPGARLAHLAPREGTKRLNPIQKRRKEVLGIDDDDRSTALKGNRPVRSKDTRSQEEIQAPLAWAERVLARHEKTKVTVLQHSHLPTARVEDVQLTPADTVNSVSTDLLLQELKELRHELCTQRYPPPTAVSPYRPSSFGRDPDAMEVDDCGMFMLPETACYDLPDMFEVYPNNQSSLSFSPSSFQLPPSSFRPPPSSFEYPPSSFESPPSSSPPPPSPSSRPLSSSLPATELPVVSSSQSEHIRVLVLGGGRPLLQCTDSDIPNAPLFKNRSIEEMARMWDDDLPLFWNPPESALRIKGHVIPLKLWPMVYSKGKGRVKANWAQNKSQWSVWRYVLLAYVNSSTTADFWTCFTDGNGKRQSFTKISAALREQRKQEDAAYANRARQTPDFDTMYISKRKGRGNVVMSRDWVIARAYRKRHGICDIYDDGSELED